MKVFITRKIPQAGIDTLKKHKEIELDYRQGAPLSTEELIEGIKDTDILVPVIPDKITKEVIEAGKNLKLIATYSVGYDHIDIETATSKNIYVSNTPGNLTEAVAEHSLALMMALGRRIVEADKYCRNKEYKYWDPMIFIGPKFMGKTLGLVGFGRIGQFFARFAKNGLGMNIIYSDPNQKIEAENLLDAKKVDLDTLLNEGDVISVHCNLSDGTKHLIDHKEFEKMKPNALLINTARGPIIDEKALAVALKEKIIGGVALDVFENEPKIHPDLLKMDNVILTPHIGSATWEARIQMANMVAENVIDVLNKKPPRYIVNEVLLSEDQNSFFSASDSSPPTENKELVKDSVKSIV